MIPPRALGARNALWWPCCVLFLLVLGRFAGDALAQEQPLCPSNLTYTGTSEASGRATARVLPDQAKVSVTVSSTKGTPTEARASGTTAFDSVTAALRSAGLNDTGIQTTGFQVEPNYAGDAYYYSRGQVPSNFTYSQTIEITSSPEELGAYIDAAVDAGGSDVRVGSVSFYISRDLAQETLDGLRGIAVANAIKSVTVMIEAAGGRVGTTISITDNSYPPYVPYASPTTSYRDSGALAADAAMPATELFSGLVDVDADVRLKMAICSEAP
jgi:uncharacterized protein YggE